MIDPQVVRRRLRKLDELVQRLREFASRDLEEFVADDLTRAACERTLQVAIQIMLDIGAHVLSDRGALDWEEYREIPLLLAREGVLPEELGRRLALAAGLRNILVHMYLDVDPVQVYGVLRDHLDVFGEFARHILAVLDKNEAG